MIQDNLYRELQIHLDKLPIGYPATESGVELELLKYFFNNLEAKAALSLGLTMSSLWRIKRRYKKKFGHGISSELLISTLDNLYMKGTIRRSGKSPYKYANAFLAIGMFEFHVDDLTPQLMELMHRYFDEGFKDEFFRSIPQLRTSPHMKAIVPEHRIDTYDNMREYVKMTKEVIGVANCVCKQGEAILGKKCEIVGDDIELCIFFGEGSYLERNRGRIITKEECLELLDKAEKKGLVIQPGNSLQAFCICLCCGCCCGVLTSAKKFEKPARLFATNYYAEIDKDKCSACGVCVKRCQMEAITKFETKLETKLDKHVELNLDRCIGCGLCVTTCAKKALSLKRKSKKTKPPMNIEMLYLSILMRRMDRKKFIISMLKLMFGIPL
jgi:Pyruvate/2-oxoacid:ferredoxin oxidoreductase delta subunit